MDRSLKEIPPEARNPWGSDLLVRDAVHGDGIIHNLQSTGAQHALTPLPARAPPPQPGVNLNGRRINQGAGLVAALERVGC